MRVGPTRKGKREEIRKSVLHKNSLLVFPPFNFGTKETLLEPFLTTTCYDEADQPSLPGGDCLPFKPNCRAEGGRCQHSGEESPQSKGLGLRVTQEKKKKRRWGAWKEGRGRDGVVLFCGTLDIPDERSKRFCIAYC